MRNRLVLISITGLILSELTFFELILILGNGGLNLQEGSADNNHPGFDFSPKPLVSSRVQFLGQISQLIQVLGSFGVVLVKRGPRVFFHPLVFYMTFIKDSGKNLFKLEVTGPRGQEITQ